MAFPIDKLKKFPDLATGLYAVFLLLWFHGLLHDGVSPWNHLFFVAAISVFVVELAAEQTAKGKDS